MPTNLVSQLKPWSQVAAGAMLGAGALGVIYLWKGSPDLEPEDATNLLKATLGFAATIGTLSFACSRGKWGFCSEVPEWPGQSSSTKIGR